MGSLGQIEEGDMREETVFSEGTIVYLAAFLLWYCAIGSGIYFVFWCLQHFHVIKG